MNIELKQGNCLEEMKALPDKSVDLILTDLPYGTTNNKWDTIIPFNEMWEQFNRVVTDNGAVVLTATQPFSSMLVMSNPKQFKYELIWEKTISSGQLNVAHQPMRSHESILVFSKQKTIYNEQLTEGTPYSISRKGKYAAGSYNAQAPSKKINKGTRHAKSVIKISNPRIKKGHPTQKPLELMEYLIKTYSNKGNVVLDCCMGSGTTGVAAKNLNRDFIGIELDKKYFKTAKQRIDNDIV